jgi:site-specific recombinase XerD
MNDLTVIQTQTELTTSNRIEIDTTLFCPIQAIRLADKAKSTEQKYIAVATKMLDSGIDLTDIEGITEYANGLSNTGKSHLGAVLKIWVAYTTQQIKANATNKNIPLEDIQRVLYQLEATVNAIKVETVKGDTVHNWLSPIEIRMLVGLPDRTSVKGKRDFVLLSVLVATGLRCDELSRLTFSDIVKRGERHLITIVGKGSKKRNIPISPKLVTITEAWKLETNSNEHDCIVKSVDRHGNVGGNMSNRGIAKVVNSYGEKIGVSTLAPHDLRRTYAQIGLDAGIPISQISKLLGHSSIATTQKYLNISLNLKSTISDFVPLVDW